MVCVPFPPKAAASAAFAPFAFARPAQSDAFGFSTAPDEMARAVENMTALWTAPWRAWMALAAESMDLRNYGPRF